MATNILNYLNILHTSDTKDSWISIVDVTGKVVKRIKLEKENGEIEISGKELKNGIYFCQLLIDGELKNNAKLVLIK